MTMGDRIVVDIAVGLRAEGAFGEAALRAEVDGTEPLGSDQLLYLEMDVASVAACVDAALPVRTVDRVDVAIGRSRALFLDPGSGRAQC